MNVIEMLSGKKTYLTGAAALVLVFGSWQKWWSIPGQAYEALMALALIFLRAGVAKHTGGTDQPKRAPSKGGSLAGVPLMALAIACIPMAFCLSLVVGGCSTTAQQATYRAAGTTAVSADAAMKMWGTYVAQSHPPVSQEQAVAAAYRKYQAAMASVCDAGEVYAAVANDTNSVYGTPATASVALQTAIAHASQEITDLDSLITSFGVHLSQTNAP